MANIVPSGETLQIFPLKSRKKRLSSSFLFNIQQGFSLTKRQGKKNKEKKKIFKKRKNIIRIEEGKE